MRTFLNKQLKLSTKIRTFLSRSKITSNFLNINNGLTSQNKAVVLDEHELAMTA
jgi:hypothetical protein